MARTFKPAAPAPTPRPPDHLGDQLIDAGFARNTYLLDTNHALSIPADFSLPAPWDLPSRLFQYPIEVHPPTDDLPRQIGLRHPFLADHPFVKHVESVLAVAIPRDPVRNQWGYSSARTAQWWHAVDLISEGHWHGLIDTAQFTTPANIFRSIIFGLRYSSQQDDRSRNGYLALRDARTMMSFLGATEPSDRTTIVRTLCAPTLNSTDRKTEHWPVNTGGTCAEDNAWAVIIGLEDGWLAYDRAGFLEWSDSGRARYAAPDGSSYAEADGQMAFGF